MTEHDAIFDQAGVSVAFVYAMDWIKKSSLFPWISNHTETLNRFLSVVVALATSAGFQVFSVSGDIDHGGVIQIAYPGIRVIFSTAIHALGQFGIQETLHKMKGNHVMVKECLDSLCRIEFTSKPALTPDLTGKSGVIVP